MIKSNASYMLTMKSIYDAFFIVGQTNVLIVGECVDTLHDVGIGAQQPKSTSLKI